MPMTERREQFETKPCGRCAGSGWYSYCQTWGHTCFQCGVKPHEQGLGRFLTRRGAAAHAYYLSLLPSKRAGDLVPGDVIRECGQWVRVQHVGDNTTEHASGRYNALGVVEYDGVNIRVGLKQPLTFCAVPVDKIYVIRPTDEQQAVALAQALEYQATLTTTGKPRKRGRAKVAA